MSANQNLQYWSIWYPKAAATGVLLARGLMDPTDELIFHAAPDVLTVEVTDAQGNRLAFGQDLEQTTESPMCRLRRVAERIQREDFWPGDHDTGKLVLLPGGETGILKGWWHAADKKEWRWQVEFYNSNRS